MYGGNVQPLAISRLLKKYKYPPEEAEDAMNIVLKQCEQWAENEEQNRIVVLEENTTVSKLSFKQPAPVRKILAKSNSENEKRGEPKLVPLYVSIKYCGIT